ncbi:MAG: PP2C family protein-serine/threonine phosphatase [Candidatus Kapabacteria bacterium]|jgi:hypothetical protein|nr:PP2C family protein-serine/threonine phosphatase [Candidatus Kapabacteria bacterium]
MYSNYLSQRDTYKLLEEISNKEYDSDISFLQTLVKDIVSHVDFEINSGRVWVLNSEEESYELNYQFGDGSDLPADYSLPITDYPFLSELNSKRTILKYETNSFLKEKGIELYSVTGVGDIEELPGGEYFKYLIGFNAPEILPLFYETLNIISGVATVTIRSIANNSRQQQIQKDFSKAAEIQKNLLPESSYKFHDYSIYGICIPSSFVGGDYFDYILNTDEQEETLAVLISDAASSGLPAAIQALFVSGAIRMGMNFSPKISQFISKLNSLIFDRFPYERFVTLFYCQLSMSSNRLVLYANAGHCPAFHYRPTEGNFKMLEPTGGLLGLMKQQTFGVENFRMHQGDVLVLYTDGITESRNKKGEFYGEQRIKNVILEMHEKSAEEISKGIIEDVNKFTGKEDRSDDKTVVIVKREYSE